MNRFDISPNFTPAVLIRFATTIGVVIAATFCTAADLRRFVNRTIKCANGCLSIEDDRRVVLQNNTSGFNGIWRMQETEQGWLISREDSGPDNKRDPKPKPAYLSYAEKSVKKESADAKPGDIVFLSETPLPTSYWKLEISQREGIREFDFQMRPRCGEYDGWYLITGDELSARKTPSGHKKFAVSFVRDKPDKPIHCLVDSP